MNNRLLRVRELLKRELGNDIQREYEFRDVLVSIHDVEVARDLKSAQVFIGIIGDADRAAGVVERLNAEHGIIQNRLAKRVVLKYTPRLHFRLDASIERGVRIVDILDSIEPAADAEEDPGNEHEAEKTDNESPGHD